jgi:hypothetical protein
MLLVLLLCAFLSTVVVLVPGVGNPAVDWIEGARDENTRG